MQPYASFTLHSVYFALKQSYKQSWEGKLATAEKMYGRHAALGLQMDRALLAQYQRGPGLRSEFAGLDSMLGRDDELDFTDYLNCE